MEKVLQESTAKIKSIIEKQNKRLTSKYNAADKRNQVSARTKQNTGGLQKDTSLAEILDSGNLVD
jgi:hypothetical protein